MYPSQTSLIPVTVALARFVESNGLLSMLGNYPYWYLGVPYRYLAGPIIPLLEVGAHKIIPSVSLFDITIYFVLFTFLLGAVGWGVLVYKIQNSKFKIQSYLIVILLAILPWRYLSALALSEASVTIARNILPWVLLAFWRVLDKGDKRSLALLDKGDRGTKRKSIAVIALVLLLLINTSILLIFLVGLVSLILAASFRKGKIRKIGRRIKNSLFLILISLFLVTFWYTPGYWVTVLANPSIGGASGVKVILRIFDLLKASIPLVLAVTTVYFSGKIRNRLTIFSLTWLFTFLFLTVFRFIGDPDFWQDWTAWLSELEIGIALLVSKKIYDLRFKNSELKARSNLKSYLLILTSLLVPFYLVWRIHLALGKPAIFSRKIPEGIRSLERLAEIAGDGSTSSFDPELRTEGLTTSRVFLSGSTVFWANALYDIYQVRGGDDKAATHPSWDKAAYELREGKESVDSLRWLNELDVSYVLVHGPKSYEYYHDFKNINKWKIIGNVVWEDGGDIIYEISK